MATRLPRLSAILAVLVAALAAVWLPACTGGGGGGCATACARDADCGFGGVCGQGTCFRPSHFCYTAPGDPYAYYAVNDRGEATDCGFYRCQDGTVDSPAPYGTCARTSTSSADCHNGTGLDAQSGLCVCGAPPAACGWANSGPPAYGACRPGCAKDADCGAGKMCWEGHCASQGQYCEFALGEWTSVNPFTPLDAGGNLQRDRTPCGTFACDLATGLCLTECQVQDDCTPATHCSGPGGVCQ